MVGVEDIVTDSMGTAIWEWFEPHFDHPFLNVQTVAVPDAVKPIPVRWIDEVQIDEGCFNGDGGDLFGDGEGGAAWSQEEGSARLREALARLDLPAEHVAHPNIDRMNRQELASEKRRVKQELKRHDAEFQKQFSRLPSHAEKEPMRPLYVYYRKLKTMIVHAEQSKHGRRNGGAGSGDESRFGRESLATIQDVDDTPRTRDQIAALEARIEALQGEKSAVRMKLQAFQEKFVTENNRKIRFHKDILPIEREYRAYKNVKEDIQKVEAQLRDLRAAEL